MSRSPDHDTLRAVIDTSVFVSGHLSRRGASHEILRRWRRGEFQLVVSEEILVEVIEQLTDKTIPVAQITELVTSILLVGLVTESLYEVDAVEADPDDNMFIAAALEASARYVVTLDNHLLALQKYWEIRIVRPSEFLAILRGARDETH